MKLRSLVFVAVAAASCGPAQPKARPPEPVPVAPAQPAQPADPPLPLWSAVKRGTLPNGLTYYVLPHKKPEKRAFLWLAVNTGSVQEDDDQRGLAHLVEHMAFNGTKNFPKQALVNYLEGIGMKFGPDLNASTSFDETIYQLQVPTDSAASIARGFDILHDWASDLTFDATEVEQERKVVLEEWRLGRGAQQRLLEKLAGALYPESRYVARIPIGLPDIIQKAPRDRLVQFYKDWYRPDLMAVVAVGDFADAAEIERAIVAKFGDLAKPAKPRPRPTAGVPPAKGPRVATATDKELPIALVAVANIVAHRPQASEKDFRRLLTEQLYQHILNERLQSIARRRDAPFATAGVIMQSFVRDVDAFARFALVKDNDVEGALRGVLTEVARVEKHGFLQAELDRARTAIGRVFEQRAAEAATTSGRALTQELVRHFLTGEAVLGAEADRDLALAMLPKITLPELDSLAKSYGGAENRAIAIAGPDGTPLPPDAKILAIVDEVGKANVEPWKEATVTTELMRAPGWPGSVAKETTNAAVGTTEWTLSNGVRVIVKPTDFEKDSVELFAVSPGGLAQAPAADFQNARFADDVAAIGGAGNLDADALGKALAGKEVTVHADINDVTESIYGHGSARDLETMLQLVYLKMSEPRKDEQAFAVWQRNTIELVTNQSRSPDAEFSRLSAEALWNGDVRHRPAKADEVKQVQLDKALAFYKSRFEDAGDFTFVIVGAVDLAKLRPLVETYLATLRATPRKEKEVDTGARRVAGVVKKTWNLGMDPDKARVQIVFHGDEPWSRDGERDMYVLSQVLGIRLREVLREDLGGVYGVGATGGISRSPHQERTFTIGFGCAPDAADKLVAATIAEIATIAKSGIGADYLDKVKQLYVRDRETSLRTNHVWTDWLARSARFGDDPALILDPAPMIARMTSDRVKAAATRYLDTKRYYQAIMLPAKK